MTLNERIQIPRYNTVADLYIPTLSLTGGNTPPFRGHLAYVIEDESLYLNTGFSWTKMFYEEGQGTPDYFSHLLYSNINWDSSWTDGTYYQMEIDDNKEYWIAPYECKVKEVLLVLENPTNKTIDSHKIMLRWRVNAQTVSETTHEIPVLGIPTPVSLFYLASGYKHYTSGYQTLDPPIYLMKNDVLEVRISEDTDDLNFFYQKGIEQGDKLSVKIQIKK